MILLTTTEKRSFMMADEIEPSHEGVYEKAKIILIVEDDEDIGSFLVSALEQETPYNPIWVSDGLLSSLFSCFLEQMFTLYFSIKGI